MRLAPANSGTPFTCHCIDCRRVLIAGNKSHGEKVYADLDGKPFEAYYCATCAGNHNPTKGNP